MSRRTNVRALATSALPEFEGVGAETPLGVGERRQSDGAEPRFQFSSTFSPTTSIREVAELIVREGVAALGATAGSVLRITDSDELELVAASGYAPDFLENFQRVSLDAALPLCDAIRRREPVLLEAAAAGAEAYPHLEGLRARMPAGAVAAIPLVLEDRVFGGIGFHFADERGFDREQRALIRAFARQGAEALERARLYESEHLARREAELSAAVLWVMDASLGRLKFDELLAALLARVTTLLRTENAAILLVSRDGKELELGASVGVQREEPDLRVPIGHGVSGVVAATREPRIFSDLSKVHVISRVLRDHVRSLAAVPLLANGDLVGVLQVGSTVPREFSEHDVRLLQLVAERFASAISREKMHAELERTLHFNEVFMTILGHDLRTPLAAITMSAQGALRMSDDERLTPPLQRILSSSERMERMIGQLQDLGRARVGGGIELKRKPTEIEALCSELVTELESTSPGSIFDVHVVGDTVGTWDADRLAEALSNLLSNAIEHGSQGAPVALRIDGTDSASVSIQVHNEGTIEPDIVSIVFEPFARARSKRVNGRGLGLGLYITREIVRAHGGTVTVQSTAAEGTTFVVELPRQA